MDQGAVVSMDLEEITGEIKRARRVNEDGFTILTVQVSKGKEATLVGVMPPFTAGMLIKARGQRTYHQTWGEQYKVTEITEEGFSNDDALVNYLAGPDFPGIGGAIARAIVRAFGDKTMDVLDNDPDQLEDVMGLSPQKRENFKQAWAEKRSVHRTIAQLMSCGFTVQMATKVNDHFNGEAIKIIQENPYRLTEVHGIGFQKADTIALKSGVPRNSQFRVEYAVKFALESTLSNGHCYCLYHALCEQTVDLLQNDVNTEAVSLSIREWEKKNVMKVEDNRVYLVTLWMAEQDVARIVHELMRYRRAPLYSDIETLRQKIESLGASDGLVLAPKQEEALLAALSSNVCVVTGGPGTGKTTATRALCALFDHHKLDMSLCSPTGQAADRLMAATTKPAATIHRLLGYTPGGEFEFRAGNPLPTDVVLVDEFSMVDIQLFRHLLAAMENNDRLIIIGDANQLPSVGPGNVLNDLIQSGVIPIVRLETIFRQAAGSAIITAAHDILRGEIPHLPKPSERKGSNCMGVIEENPQKLIEHIVTLVTKVLPKSGLLLDDIQVISPMREKGLGINDLNPVLQAALNPPSPEKEEVRHGFRVFRTGDRVMHLRNDYKKEVFNGNVGKIIRINKVGENSTIFVLYKGRKTQTDENDPVAYQVGELDDLQHCFCSTVHKVQGAEYPCVILLCHNVHGNMLQRKLLYTGLTRAKQFCIVGGTMAAVERAVNNTAEFKRNTTLKQILIKRFQDVPV